MMSADATGSFTTSAHPAARGTGSRRERIATIANATTASTTTSEAHLGHLKIILGFIWLLHESAVSASERRYARGLPPPEMPPFRAAVFADHFGAGNGLERHII
jgi:hypothetical protein